MTMKRFSVCAVGELAGTPNTIKIIHQEAIAQSNAEACGLVTEAMNKVFPYYGVRAVNAFEIKQS